MQDPDRIRAQIGTATEHVAGEIENLRAIITDLRPAALDELGLVPALVSLAQRTATRAGLEVTTNLGDSDDAERLPAPVEVAVYRIAQEALTNVAKHAGATNVSLGLRVAAGAVTLEISDDGEGFDPDAATSGFGLVGMVERAGIAGGTLEIAREDGRTVVRAALPARA